MKGVNEYIVNSIMFKNYENCSDCFYKLQYEKMCQDYYLIKSSMKDLQLKYEKVSHQNAIYNLHSNGWLRSLEHGRRKKDINIFRLIELRASGLNYFQVAKELGVSYKTLYRRLKQFEYL